jgi:hypothetical protein
VPNQLPPAGLNWETNDFPVITPDIAALNNMIIHGTSPCLPNPNAQPLKPHGVNTVAKPSAAAPLQPLKLYTALYNAVYKPGSLAGALPEPQKREVYRHAFQTSRYGDFKEHINSYILQRNVQTGAVEKTAVYVIKKAFTDPTVVSRAKQVLAGTLPANDPLHREAALLFDKLTARLFEIGGLEPPETVQFNLIWDTVSRRALGILVRSPEPFNDPRMPASEMAKTLEVRTSGLGKTNKYSVYFSKDNASAFITNFNHALHLPAALGFTFRFKYLLYNGKEYEEKDSETVTLHFVAVQKLKQSALSAHVSQK